MSGSLRPPPAPPTGRPPPPRPNGKLVAVARGQMTLAAALDVSDDALRAARSLGSMLARHGREERARLIFEGLVALDEQDAWSWRALAALALRRGDAAAALETAGRAAQVARGRGQSDPEAALLVARALLAHRRAAEAGPWLASAASDPVALHSTRRTARALGRRLRGVE